MHRAPCTVYRITASEFVRDAVMWYEQSWGEPEPVRTFTPAPKPSKRR